MSWLSWWDRKDWGRIVFISSESGIQIPKEMIHYGMTKTAQIAIARGVAESVAGTGITVNSVLPGPTESEGVAQFVTDLARQLMVPTRKSLVGFLLIVIAAWGVLSTTALTVFILSKDPDPDHRVIIKMGVGLILIWCVLGGMVMWGSGTASSAGRPASLWAGEPGLCCSASLSPCWKRR
jgi:hypothetical protein